MKNNRKEVLNGMNFCFFNNIAIETIFVRYGAISCKQYIKF